MAASRDDDCEHKNKMFSIRFDWIRFVSNKTGNKKHLQQKLCGFFIRIFFFWFSFVRLKVGKKKEKNEIKR